MAEQNFRLSTLDKQNIAQANFGVAAQEPVGFCGTFVNLFTKHFVTQLGVFGFRFACTTFTIYIKLHKLFDRQINLT